MKIRLVTSAVQPGSPIRARCAKRETGKPRAGGSNVTKRKVDLPRCFSVERYLYFSPSEREGMLFWLGTGFKTLSLGGNEMLKKKKINIGSEQLFPSG